MIRVAAGLTGFFIILINLTGCTTHTFDVYGSDVASTTVPIEKLMGAIHDIHQELGCYTIKSDGSKHDASYIHSSRSWRTKNNPLTNKTQRDLLRTKTSFQDTQGRLISIEIIQEKPRPILIFIDYNKVNGSLSVLNRLRASLQKQNIKLN